MKVRAKKVVDSILSILLVMVMFMGMLPVNVLAATDGVLPTNIDTVIFNVGQASEFTFTTTANNDAGILVVGSFEFSDPDAIEKLEYKESKDGNWYEFYGDFGPSTGFPMTDATSHFRVTFNKSGTYSVTASIKRVDDGTVLCSTTKDVMVIETSPVLTTNIGDKSFVTGQPTEFSFTTTANDASGVMVLGSFEFSDPDAIEKLEYRESKDGNWYEFYGDFGPNTGFPMTDATSYFRVTFKKSGNFSVNAHIKRADNGTILCSTGSIPLAVISKYDINVTANQGGSFTLNGEKISSLSVDEGSEVSLFAEADNGYQISSVSIGGVEQELESKDKFSKSIVVSADTSINISFVKVYKITVSYNDEFGTVVTSPECSGGEVIVNTGDTVSIVASPNKNYRVSEVTVNGAIDSAVKGDNDEKYEKKFSADADYKFVITFAPNNYNIEIGKTENGTAFSTASTVEYGGDVTVKLLPNEGYTVNNVKVNDIAVESIIKDSSGIYFNIKNIEKDQTIVVTYKEIAKAEQSDLIIDSSEALRVNENLMVIKDGSKIVFSTQKSGIRVYNADGIIAGNETEQSVSVGTNTEITAIEIYYKAENEYYAEWHKVVRDNIRISVDKGDNIVAQLVPVASANNKGYYNSDVVFTVNAEDTGDYSGIQLVEYWIVYNGTQGAPITLYEHQGEINNLFADSEKLVVDASVYNSNDVKVVLRVVDRAGNEKQVEKLLKINSTKPTVALSIDGTQNSNAKDGYYNDTRTLTITIVDREDTFSQENVAKGLVVKRNNEDVTVKLSDIVWKHVPGSNQYEGTYKFENDGHYSLSFVYENLASMTNDGITVDATSKDVYSFCVDKTEPYNLSISYEPDFVGVLLDALTFGFYKSPVNVTVKAIDDTAGIESFECAYGEAKITLSGENIIRNDNEATATFTIPAQFRGSVSAKAVDRAGRSIAVVDDKIVVIDTVAPGVTVQWDSIRGYNGKYYNTDRTATITIVEDNFFEQDVEDGLLNITASIVYNDGRREVKTYKPSFDLKDGKYEAKITFGDEADYTFDIKYTDRSGNVYDEYVPEEFVIDKTAPVIEVQFDNNSAANEKYFKDARKTTITVVEHNFDATAMNILVNGSSASVEWTKDEKSADTYIAEYLFIGDADYTFDVEGLDLANNTSEAAKVAEGTVAPWAFTVDTSSPIDLKITYEPTFVGVLLEGITYGFYKSPVNVTIEAADDISGVDNFVYSYAVQEGASDTNVGKNNQTVAATRDGDTDRYYATFPIPAQFRGFVSFTATNKADLSASKADTNAVVVDDIAPGVSVEWRNNNAKNDNYYNAEREAVIKIEEANFFEQDIEDGLLAITVEKTLNDGTYTSTKMSPTFTKNGDAYTAVIKFDEDADYTFDIKYTDRSGNVYDEYVPEEFVIDKTAPVIEVQFDNNSAANEKYFKDARKVTITVVEHNFRASDFEFTAEAYNVLGETEANKIDLSSKAYQTYLKDQDNWEKVAADTWEATITFDIEGNYAIGATYSDLADNAQIEAISDTFCVDKTAPENLKITYKSTFVGVLLENLTFGFYNAPVEVTIEATDDIAGVDYFVYSYAVQEGSSDTNAGKLNQNVKATRDGSTNRWFTTFEIPAQFRGNVSFTVYDKATNDNNLEDKNIVVVDNVAPGINVEYNNNSDYDDGFYNGDRTATITIAEANFFEQDIEDGLLVITVEKTLNDGTYTSTKMSPTFTKNGDVYTATIDFTENADYTFHIKYTDRSGNVYDSYEKDIFAVDKTAPIIDVTYDNNDAKNVDQFKEDRTATIQIKEHNFDATKVVAKVTANGAEVPSYAEYLSKKDSWKPVEGQLDIWQAVIEYTDEAHYTFEISCTDKAGNINSKVNYGDSVAPAAFTLDKTAPANMDIKIAEKSVLGSMSTHAFDTFYGKTVVVKLSANCDISGLESFKYQKVADVSEYDENGTWIDYNEKTGISIAPTEKFVIYFRAEDRAGNVSIVRSTGIVVDDQKPIGEKNAPEIDILPEAPDSNGIHNDKVSVAIKVVDPKYNGVNAANDGYYSGLNKITYKIYTTDTKAVEEGILLDLASKTDGAVFDADKLVSSWSGNITIDPDKFNSNNVIVEVVAVDNAGNERKTATTAGDIKIDTTKPVITVLYDNNSADSKTFFKDNRTATVIITERNFSAEDVVVTITNTDGTVPVISGFTKSAGTGNGDDTKWTATIKYTADGDYKFDIAYTDLAGNDCPGETFSEGTVAPNAFTIDHIAPTVVVTYDNNDALNGNYYKAVRTATIVITEHNFNAERVRITNTATDDGVDISKPIVSGWTSNGNKHTATISYNKDAKYTFDIEVSDKAGNVSADYNEETFFVDTTMPTLEIKGIGDKSPNKGDVIPVVSYSDTNYDAEKVTITLTGANRKRVELEGTYADIHNGRIFTFKNFAKEKEIDDIYTLTASLTDKAGNTTEKTITFSVNRFGSTYALSEVAEKLNGTYVKEPVDVVITETNADELSNIKVTLFKDGEAKVLEEGTDYKIDVTGGNGQWYHYTYTIFAKNFNADGVYSLTVESNDKAGNEAKNDQDTKNTSINFGVDSTLPIINIENLESHTTYALDNMTVTMSVKDNLNLSKVIVELDGEEYKVWTGGELKEIIENGGNFSFNITGDSTDSHNLIVYAIDEAGNGERTSDTELPANAEKIEDFYVTTNLWIRYYTNKPLFFGSIAGVIVIAGLIVFLVVYKKKKNEDK